MAHHNVKAIYSVDLCGDGGATHTHSMLQQRRQHAKNVFSG